MSIRRLRATASVAPSRCGFDSLGRSIAFLFCSALVACTPGEVPAPAAIAAPAAQVASVPEQPSRPAVPFTALQICKAAIGVIMDQKPSIIRTSETAPGEFVLSYKRPDDGTTWRYRCRLEGDRVMWATEPGRWRNDPMDEVVKFGVADGVLTITRPFSDGSAATDNFQLAQLK